MDRTGYTSNSVDTWQQRMNGCQRNRSLSRITHVDAAYFHRSSRFIIDGFRIIRHHFSGVSGVCLHHSTSQDRIPPALNLSVCSLIFPEHNVSQRAITAGAAHPLHFSTNEFRVLAIEIRFTLQPPYRQSLVRLEQCKPFLSFSFESAQYALRRQFAQLYMRASLADVSEGSERNKGREMVAGRVAWAG